LSAEIEALELDRGVDPHVTGYSRRSIPNDKEIAPFTLTGVKRTVFLVLYVLIVSASIAGVAYTFYARPLFGLLMLPVCYIINNFLFLTGHTRLHSSFIELREDEMNVLCHHSFIHHYRNIQVYHEHWLETRMSYFIDPRTIVGRAFNGFVIGVPLISFILYRIEPVLGIAFFSSQFAAELLQSTIHEWYHNPVRNRKSFYTFPVYWGMTLLEKAGLASTKHHQVHHGHQLKDLDNVLVWLDLWVPFGETLPTLLWKKALPKYVPGQANMTRLIEGVGALFTISVFFLLNPLIYVAIFKLLR
jgi:hypothetical protein